MNELDAKLQSLGARTAVLTPPADALTRLQAALDVEAHAPSNGPDLRGLELPGRTPTGLWVGLGVLGTLLITVAIALLVPHVFRDSTPRPSLAARALQQCRCPLPQPEWEGASPVTVDREVKPRPPPPTQAEIFERWSHDVTRRLEPCSTDDRARLLEHVAAKVCASAARAHRDTVELMAIHDRYWKETGERLPDYGLGTAPSYVETFAILFDRSARELRTHVTFRCDLDAPLAAAPIARCEPPQVSSLGSLYIPRPRLPPGDSQAERNAAVYAALDFPRWKRLLREKREDDLELLAQVQDAAEKARLLHERIETTCRSEEMLRGDEEGVALLNDDVRVFDALLRKLEPDAPAPCRNPPGAPPR